MRPAWFVVWLLFPLAHCLLDMPYLAASHDSKLKIKWRVRFLAKLIWHCVYRAKSIMASSTEGRESGNPIRVAPLWSPPAAACRCGRGSVGPRGPRRPRRRRKEHAHTGVGLGDAAAAMCDGKNGLARTQEGPER